MAVDSACRWWVYVLNCRGNRLYTGIAKDVMARFSQHQTGKGARFTRAFPPEQLLAAAPFPDHSTALREERRIKALTRQEKLLLVRRWQSDFPLLDTSNT